MSERTLDTPRAAATPPHGEGVRARGWARVVQSLVIALAGAAGLAVLLAALAPVAGMQLLRLQTGSMSPELPTGSVVLARDVAATQVRPGDIVTVRRPDGAAVTHRVVEVEPAGAGARLVLKGDANRDVDPAPYLATRVGLIVAGVPFGGAALEALEHPAAVPVLSVVASALVLWAWWPQRRHPAHRAPRLRGETGVTA